MADGIYVALSGALAQERSLDITANNLANAQTAGYQKTRPIFEEALAKARGNQLRYVQVARSATDTTRGAVRQTGRGLDVALPEGTYLAVKTPQGERYTRACSLQVDAEGNMRTAEGHDVLGEGGAIATVPTDGAVTISRDGNVTQGTNSVGRLRLVQFKDASSLVHEGRNTLAATGASGVAQSTESSVDVGAIEESGVSVFGGMNEMIAATRAFAAFERTLDSFQQADHMAATKVASST